MPNRSFIISAMDNFNSVYGTVLLLILYYSVNFSDSDCDHQALLQR